MGSLLIILPPGVGAQAYHEDSWLSSCSLQKFRDTGDGTYETANYRKASKKVKIRLESGVGSIDVKWRK